ncbi:hypothetical protein [Pseudobutyrivibrio sp.]|uniref:hypothetical protein n=1 Tax=Pseudobutyrivibrio sp. TaxID=2014367 RepID=UPI0025EA208F|nr:hypothetical protein [Pseudobutyrivibrio sp.]MBR5650558.1 hypothetical protein [Pseudobutyrivibrio sp.]
MKKSIMLSMVLATVLAVGHSTVSKAASGVELNYENIGISVTLSDKYNYVYDADNIYGDDISEYGINPDTFVKKIKSTPEAYFVALYVDDNNYFRESGLKFFEGEEKIGHLKDYSKEEVAELAENSSKESEEWVGKYGIKSVEYKDIFYTEGGLPYFQTIITGTNEQGDYTAGCLYTIANNNYYYFYTRSYAPSVDADSVLKDSQELVEGVEITYDKTIKSNANISGGIDWEQVGAKSAYGAVIGAVVGGVGVRFGRKIKKNKVKNTVEKA